MQQDLKFGHKKVKYHLMVAKFGYIWNCQITQFFFFYQSTHSADNLNQTIKFQLKFGILMAFNLVVLFTFLVIPLTTLTSVVSIAHVQTKFVDFRSNYFSSAILGKKKKFDEGCRMKWSGQCGKQHKILFVF